MASRRHSGGALASAVGLSVLKLGRALGHNPLPPDTRVSFVVAPNGGRPRIASMQYSFIAPVP